MTKNKEEKAVARFEFRDYTLKLEFPGCEFTVICDSDLNDMVQGLSAETQTLHRDYVAGKTTKQMASERVLTFIDQILGEGAANKIFDGKERTFSNITDVFCFIVIEITSHIKKVNASRKWVLGATAHDQPETTGETLTVLIND